LIGEDAAMSDYSSRISRLQSELRSEGAAGAILAGSDQMRYLTGWQEGGHERFVGLLVPADGDPVFLVPAMNAEQARGNPAGISRVVGWDDATGWRNAARELIGAWPPTGTLLVDDELRSVHLLALQAQNPERRFEAVGSVLCRLREVKGADELQAMERAAATIDAVFEDVIVQLTEGITEQETAGLVLGAIRVRGSQPSFAPLICFGPNAALPHHHTGDRPLRRGDAVIIDIGCVDSGYASDITRTVAFGEPADPDARPIYQLVMAAHTAARAAARPGVTGEAVDAAARSLIVEAGYGDAFLHRTGHGIGLSVHEPPDIVKGNTEPLKKGMCFSIEPGVYLSGRFGVRIENIVTVTADGVRSLNAEPDPQLRTILVR
jgi:Xaa-Pro aminopeptidase